MLASIWFVSPTNLHCSQTEAILLVWLGWFVSPTNLHCSQTECHIYYKFTEFVSPTNLHCSQTFLSDTSFLHGFVSPTNLHCSQTVMLGVLVWFSLFPLRIYTALKPAVSNYTSGDSLFPLRIYTALKQAVKRTAVAVEFVSPTNLHCSQTLPLHQ